MHAYYPRASFGAGGHARGGNGRRQTYEVLWGSRTQTRLKRMQYRPGLIDGFLAKTGLDLTPFSNLHN